MKACSGKSGQIYRKVPGCRCRKSVGKVSEVISAWLVNKSIRLGFHSSWSSDVKLVTLATVDKGVLGYCGFYDQKLGSTRDEGSDYCE